MTKINTHNLVCDFGRHEGTLYTRLPVSYLKWMVNSGHSKADIAKAELERRGTTTPTMEITGHAIDRASQQLLDLWQNDRKAEERGLHNWLCWMAELARLANHRDSHGRYIFLGICFVFEEGSCWPVLKTVVRE